MEQIARIMEQALTNLQISLPDTTNKTEISIYGEGRVSSKTLADCFVKLKQAFPKLSTGWYDILQQMLIEEKFTDQRLTDATNNLIKTAMYPTPTIANILGFDKKSKLWTYNEILEYIKDFSQERKKSFWDSMEIYDKEKKLWKLK